MELLGQYNYWVVFFLMMTGLYLVIARGNLIKKIVGLNIFQTSVFLLYISMGRVTGGTAPIVSAPMVAAQETVYSNPLPHVLILTAIVVGIATTALGLALVVRIKEAYGTVEEDEIYAQDEALDHPLASDAIASLSVSRPTTTATTAAAMDAGVDGEADAGADAALSDRDAKRGSSGDDGFGNDREPGL